MVGTMPFPPPYAHKHSVWYLINTFCCMNGWMHNGLGEIPKWGASQELSYKGSIVGEETHSCFQIIQMFVHWTIWGIIFGTYSTYGDIRWLQLWVLPGPPWQLTRQPPPLAVIGVGNGIRAPCSNGAALWKWSEPGEAEIDWLIRLKSGCYATAKSSWGSWELSWDKLGGANWSKWVEHNALIEKSRQHP